MSGDACRKGLQTVAAREVEVHEAAELPEPFGEWSYAEGGSEAF